MSKGQDVQAYTRLLKFQKKRYGVGLIDYFVLLLSLIIMIGVTLILTNSAQGSGATFLFIVGAIFVVLIIISFFDYSLNIGLFQEKSLYYSATIILGAVLISLIVSVGANEIFSNSDNADILSMLSLLNLLTNAAIITYYVTTSTPTREGREEMIQKLTEIRKEITKVSISELGSTNAVDRAIKWLQFQQRPDGIWGESNPLYETSEVLRMFTDMKKGLDYSWKTIVNGTEETHTVEQTYYLILEALDTASIEPTNETLISVLSVAEIDPQHINIEDEIYQEFKETIERSGEWEFVKDIQKFDETNSRMEELPIIFPMAKIFLLKKDYETTQKCADIIANTFGILINRASSRFNITTDKEISNLVLGKMYNTIISLVRVHSSPQEINFFEDYSSDKTDDFNLPEMDSFDMDSSSSMDLPDMDFDLSSKSDPLPDAESLSTDQRIDQEIPNNQIKIGTSLASIRNYIRGKQSIDGSWSGNIEFTTECLLAVSDQESSESEFIKYAVHYLLALQEKNGSWQNDVVLTAKISSVLHRINQTIDLSMF